MMLLATPARAGMILENPSFESGLDPWFAGLFPWGFQDLGPWWYADFGTPELTNVEARSGSFSISAFALDQIRQNFAATPVSDITEVSFWAKKEVRFASVALYYSDNTADSVHVFGEPVSGGLADQWRFFDATPLLTPGKSLTGIGVFGTGPPPVVPAYFDDFKIATATATNVAAVPEPGTLTLFGLGSLGLVGFARRRRRAI